MYLEPWHLDIFDFLELKKNTGKEEQRARDLFYGMWIPDLFMERVEKDQVCGSKMVKKLRAKFANESMFYNL